MLLVERLGALVPARLAVMASSVAVTSLGTYLGRLPEVIAAVAVAGVTIASLRYPVVLLALYVALFPWTEMMVTAGLPSVPSYVGVAFVAVWFVTSFRTWKPTIIPPVGWAWLLLVFGSGAWAIDRAMWADRSASLLVVVMVTIAGAHVLVHNRHVIRPLLWTYVLSVAAIAALALMGSYDWSAEGSSVARLTLTEEQNPARFAGRMLPALAFVLAELRQHGIWRLAATGCLALIAPAIVLSGTLSAWVGAIIVATTMAWIFLSDAGPRRVRVALSAAVVAVLMAVVLQVSSDLVAGRLERGSEVSASARLDIWNVGLGMVAQAPVLGVGFGNYPAGFTAQAIVNAPFEIRDVAAVSIPRSSHNIYMGAFAELGVVGLIVLAGFSLALWRMGGGGSDHATWRAMFIGVIAQSLFTDILTERSFWLPIMLLLVAGASIGRVASLGRDDISTSRDLKPVDRRAQRRVRAE